jgi:hypothetical protein
MIPLHLYQTPETSNAEWTAYDGKGGIHSVVHVHVSRKIEWEREDARKERDQLRHTVTQLTLDIMGIRRQLERERDEARKKTQL